jgi:DNA repair protein SbcC/Rad50
VLIDRIYLRNYRVFEDELELYLPPGLVGVYGPNGAGKSTLLESILWALWGRARTPKEGVPSAGAHGECVAEVTFEQEGHIYLVRRTISGINATVKAEAHCDGQGMAEGARDTSRYVHSVLGMDDAAFRASVFAEQKQLAAFSSQGPAERRKLVLSLLGVTPLDAARDKARADARDTTQQHGRLRSMLPDLEEARMAAADKEAQAGAAEVGAVEEETAAAAVQALVRSSKEELGALDLVRQEHEVLMVQGRAARAELDAAGEEVASVTAELSGLAEATARLGDLAPVAARLPGAEQRAQLVAAVTAAAKQLTALPPTAPPPAPDEEALVAASEATMAARSALGSAQAGAQAAAAELDRAKQASSKSESLSGEEDCPLCGQTLGEAFAQVQAHRTAELHEAQDRVSRSQVALAGASTVAKAALADMERLSARVEAARRDRATWDQAQARRADAVERLEAALSLLEGTDPDLASALGPAPGPEALAQAQRHADEDLSVCRSARDEAGRLQGRLERRPVAELSLRRAEERAAAATSLVETLRAKVKGLRFDQSALTRAQETLRTAEEAFDQANAAARRARLAAVATRAEATAEAKRVSEAEAQHGLLVDLESRSVHLSRTAELLNAFRNGVVASVGPRLAVQAAELFDELTDSEYDRLEVDGETYGLHITDGGIPYDLERFSGSEVDLANLALRVAISEHVRFQSGGTVGLLVLDEIFGPLDEERRARMLLALERLRGRFRQILVVTHSTEIKEQLPHAIEVQKRPGRRATAHVMGGPEG